MGLLDGKTALVTGASKGIGKAIATTFVKEGANVAFTYLSSVEKGQALEGELAVYGTKIKGYRSNAADFAAAEELVNNIVAEFGSLDVMVNNAGITRDNLLMRMNEEMWDEVINVNLKSCFNTVKAATRTMMKQEAAPSSISLQLSVLREMPDKPIMQHLRQGLSDLLSLLPLN